MPTQPAKPAASESHCPKCGYALQGLTRCICPECGFNFDPTVLDWRSRHAFHRRWPFAFLVAAFILYAPHGWLLFVDYPWDDQRLLWLKLWPILPGLPALLIERFVLDGSIPDWGEFISMAVFTFLALLLFTWIASRGKRALIAVIILLTPPSVYLGIVSHALFRM